MQYVYGNLWDFHPQGVVAVTTNGIIKKNGELVMGKGIALQAAQRFPDIPARLGKAVKAYGNFTFYMEDHRIMSFPTKDHWKDHSDLIIIKASAVNAMILAKHFNLSHVFLTPPGCGNGGLHWAQVEPIISPILDNRFHIVLQ